MYYCAALSKQQRGRGTAVQVRPRHCQKGFRKVSNYAAHVIQSKPPNWVKHLQHCDEQFMRGVRSTLLGLPCRFERLVYIASFQNPENRDQFSHLLPLDYDREKVDLELSREHHRIFEDWLALALEEKLADLEAYASGRGEDMAEIAYQWLVPERRADLVPRGAFPPEKLLFHSDVEMLLMILRGRR